jgi:hypothetical protein
LKQLKPKQRTGEALLPAKPDNPQFRDCPLTGHVADMPGRVLAQAVHGVALIEMTGM